MTQTPSTGTQLLERILIQLEYQSVELIGINARLDNLHEAISVSHSSNGSTPEDTDNLVEFDATEIVTTFDDSDTRKLFRIKGGQFSTYGLRVWDEVLQQFGYDPEDLEPGSTPFTERVVAEQILDGTSSYGKQVVVQGPGKVLSAPYRAVLLCTYNITK